MFSNNQNLLSLLSQTPSGFSDLIRPSTPCIFGREDYDDQTMHNDEFFLTANGIFHSCPNIDELSSNNNNNNRKWQSCDHSMFINEQTVLNNHDNLNCYDTESNYYPGLFTFSWKFILNHINRFRI